MLLTNLLQILLIFRRGNDQRHLLPAFVSRAQYLKRYAIRSISQKIEIFNHLIITDQSLTDVKSKERFRCGNGSIQFSFSTEIIFVLTKNRNICQEDRKSDVKGNRMKGRGARVRMNRQSRGEV